MNNEINDFGEKIGGARKDLWKSRGLIIDDITEMNESERESYIKKDNVWPKPNYQQLYESGLSKELVYYIKTVRDGCPTKPSSTKYQEEYINLIKDIKDAALGLKSDSQIGSLLTVLKDKGYIENQSRYLLNVLPKAGYNINNKLLKAIQTSQGKITREVNTKQFLYTDEEKILSNFEIICYDADKVKFSKSYNGQDCMEVKVGYGTNYYYPKNSEYTNPENYTPETFFIVNPSRGIIGKNFNTIEEAQKYCLDISKPKEQEETKEQQDDKPKRKKAYIPPMLQGLKRTGEDYRTGVNVAGEDYLNTFGFRGGEFGNWLNDNERQQSLNFGFDAFKDLASALGVKDEAVSLNGNLAIAFGARGKGTAAAHYEPLREVINLTKMSGAGALAHEWIHALDDSLGREFGCKGFFSEKCLSAPEPFKDLINTIFEKKIEGDSAVNYFETRLSILENKVKQEIQLILPDTVLSKEDIKQRDKYIKEFIDISKKDNDLIYINKFANISEMCQEITGKKLSLYEFNVLNTYSHKINLENANLVEARDNNKKFTVPTDFSRDAKQLDDIFSKHGHGYWNSKVEMVARAGACYIKDKLESQGKRNDYLCGYADSMIFPGEQGMIYGAPQNEERKVINAAFDKCFEYIRENNLLPFVEINNEQEKASLDSLIASAEKNRASLSSSHNKNKDDISL